MVSYIDLCKIVRGMKLILALRLYFPLFLRFCGEKVNMFRINILTENDFHESHIAMIDSSVWRFHRVHHVHLHHIDSSTKDENYPKQQKVP